jgi:hypothetical protein
MWNERAFTVDVRPVRQSRATIKTASFLFIDSPFISYSHNVLAVSFMFYQHLGETPDVMKGVVKGRGRNPDDIRLAKIAFDPSGLKLLE